MRRSRALGSFGLGLRTIVLVLLAASRAPAQTTGAPAEDAFARIESAIARTMADEHITGLSVAVVEGDRIRFSRGYGLADVENFVPFTPATVWRLGSVSKPLTAVAAMQLVERRRLDLDRPI